MSEFVNQLVELAKAGDRDAMETLFVRFDRKIHAVAAKWRIDGWDKEDKVGLCNRAFVKAIRRFDPSGGRNFDSWAELVLERHMTMAYRKAVAPGQIKAWKTVSLDEPRTDDSACLADTIEADSDYLDFNIAFDEVWERIGKTQVAEFRQHVRQAARTPLGAVLSFWVAARSKQTTDSAVLDLLDPSPMIRIMRFGTQGDLSSHFATKAAISSFRAFLGDQRCLMAFLADVRPLGRNLDAVDHRMIKEIRRHGG